VNRHTVSGRWKLGLALAMLTAFQFGAIPIVLKLLLKKIDPITLSWYRFTVAAVFLGLFSFRTHDLMAPLRLRGKSLVLLIVAVLGLSINYVLYTLGLEYSSPNTAQVMIQLAPMLLLLGGLLIFKESFSVRQGVGVLALIIGLIFFFDGKYDEILSGSSTLWMGILLVSLSAALWASYGLAQKQLLTVLSGPSIMFVVYIAGSVMYLIRAKPLTAASLTPIEWALLALSAMFATVSYVCLAAAMNHLEASRVSVVLATPPIFTVVMVAILAPIFPEYVQAEPISALTTVGILLVVAGSILASMKPGSASS
jgi:drug/metabolite transporter (DMT)-like permease